MSKSYTWQKITDQHDIKTIRDLSRQFEVSVEDYDRAEALYFLDVSAFVEAFVKGQRALIQEFFPNIRRPFLDDLTIEVGQEALSHIINDPCPEKRSRKDLEMALLHEILGMSLNDGRMVEDIAIPVNCIDVEPDADNKGYVGAVQVYIPETTYEAQGFTCG